MSTQSPIHRVSQRILRGLTGLCLAISLAACGGSGGGDDKGNKKPPVDPNNAAPTIDVNNGLVIDEDSSQLITSSRLSASDADNTSAELDYIITQLPANGVVELLGVALAADGRFTQADLDGSAVRFVHDGGEAATDEFRFTLTDGNKQIADQVFAITVNPVNDAPAITANSPLTVPQATSRSITAANLTTSDPDDAPADIIYTLASAPVNGQILVSNVAQSVGGTFSQAEIDAGVVVYAHDASNTTSDSFDFTVTDGPSAPQPDTFLINMTVPANFNGTAPVVNGTIELLAVDGFGLPILPAIASGNTDASGNFSISIPANQRPLLVRLTDGTYRDETKPGENRSFALTGTQELLGFVPENVDSFVATPYTHAMVLRGRRAAVGGNFNETMAEIDSRIRAAISSTSDSLPIGLGIFETLPADPINPSGSATLLEKQYGMMIGGFSEAIQRAVVALPSQSAANYEILAALIDDLSDGRMNGQDENNVPITVAGEQLPQPGDIDEILINSQIRIFRNNNASAGEAYENIARVLIDEAALSTPVVVPNDPPVAVDDSYTGDQGALLSVLPAGVLSNDSDPENKPITATLVTGPGFAAAFTLNADGSFDYTHDGSTNLSDSFTYTASDGTNVSNVATVNLTINDLNTPPTIDTNGGLTLNEATSADITSAELSASDTDQAATQLTYTVTSLPVNGTLNRVGSPLGVGGTFTQADIDGLNIDYAHNGSETTTDSFGFDLSDGVGGNVTGQTFNISVAPVSDTPTLANSGLSVNEGDVDTLVTASALFASDVDNTPGELLYTVTTLPPNGSLKRAVSTLTVGGTFTQADVDGNIVSYTHDGGESTSDSFIFDLSDGTNNITGQTFNVSVTPVNDAPVVAQNNGLTVNEGDVDTVIANTDLQATDADVPADTLTFTLTGLPVNGTLKLGVSALALSGTFTQADIDAGQVSYSHDGSETLSDSFQFDLSDGTAADDVTGQTFSITVNAINNAPTLTSNVPRALDEGEADKIIRKPDLEWEDADNTPIELQYTLTVLPVNGILKLSATTLVLNANFTQDDIDKGRLTYSHDGTETTSDSFGYDISDGTNNISGQSFSLIITPVNDAPTVDVNTGLTVTEGDAPTTITSAMLSSSDPDNIPSELVYDIDFVPSGGVLRLGGTALGNTDSFTQADINAALITYEHGGGEGSPDTFRFDLDDTANAGPVDVVFTITVNPVNDPPVVVVNTGLTLDEGAVDQVISSGELQTTDADIPADTLTYTVTTAAANGVLKRGATALAVNDTFTQADIDGGFLSYSHDGGEATGDSFIFDVSDGTPADDVAGQTFSFTITPVNDAPVITQNNGLTVNEGDVDTVITNAELQATDADLPADTLTYQVKSTPAFGTLKNGATTLGTNGTFTQADVDAGNVTYTHDASEGRPDSFEFDLSDGTTADDINGQTFSITITPVNDAPVIAQNNGLTVAEGDIDTVITNAELQATDVDLPADTLTYTVTTIPVNGTLKNGASTLGVSGTFSQADVDAGSLTYTHDGGETTADSFQFDLSDGTTADDITGQTFSMTVTAVDDTPAVTTNAGLSVSQSATVTVTTAMLETTDPDNLPTQLTYTVTTLPVNGTLIVNSVPMLSAGGNFTQDDIDNNLLDYQHDGSATTTDSFDFDVTDGNSGVTGNSFAITINLNAPTANADSITVDEGATAYTLDNSTPADTSDDYYSVLDNDSDPNSDPLTAILVTGPANAVSFVLKEDGSLVYVHDGSDTPVTDSFTYKANDGGSDSNTVTVTITIRPDTDEDGIADVNDSNAATADPDTDGVPENIETLAGTDETPITGVNDVIHVRPTGNNANDGLSWDNAVANFQGALSRVNALAESPNPVYVLMEEGTYSGPGAVITLDGTNNNEDQLIVVGSLQVSASSGAALVSNIPAYPPTTIIDAAASSTPTNERRPAYVVGTGSTAVQLMYLKLTNGWTPPTPVAQSLTTGCDGGGLLVSDSATAVVRFTHIADNYAECEGGGFHVEEGSVLTISDSLVQGNVANGFGAGGGEHGGGGGSVLGGLTMERSIIADNVAADAGGGRDGGGGLYLDPGSAASDTISITNSMILSNKSAELGGGVIIDDRDTVSPNSVDMFNVLIVGNIAANDSGGVNGQGGGLYIGREPQGGCPSSLKADLREATIAFNQSNSDAGDTGGGGGVFVDAANCMSQVTLTNSIVYFNDDSDPTAILALEEFRDSGAIMGLNNNNIFNNPNVGGAGNIDANPFFERGFYLNQVAPSPSIDAGNDPATTSGYDLLTTSKVGERDAGQLDMGFHYNVGADPVPDDVVLEGTTCLGTDDFYVDLRFLGAGSTFPIGPGHIVAVERLTGDGTLSAYTDLQPFGANSTYAIDRGDGVYRVRYQADSSGGNRQFRYTFDNETQLSILLTLPNCP